MAVTRARTTAATVERRSESLLLGVTRAIVRICPY
jgi:hypothetical protein